MIATVFQTVRRVGILLMLTALGWQQAAAQSAAQSTCTKGVFVYLDASGSMYTADIIPKVVYLGQEMFIMDAMLKFVGSTFGASGALAPGDRFSLDIFAKSVKSLEQIDSFNPAQHAPRIRTLFDRNERTSDGTNPWRYLGFTHDEIQETNYVALLDEVVRDVRGFNGRSVVIIFTDAEDEDEKQITALADRLSEFKVQAGRVSILVIPLYSNLITQKFEEVKNISVAKFILGDTDNTQLVRDVRDRITQTVQGQVEVIGNEDIEVIKNDSTFSFLIPVRSTSCVQEATTVYVHYEILPAWGGDPVKRSGDFVSIEFDPSVKPIAKMDIDLSTLDNRSYDITFELSQGGIGTGVLEDFEKGGSFPFLLAFVLLLFVVAVITGIFFARQSGDHPAIRT